MKYVKYMYTINLIVMILIEIQMILVDIFVMLFEIFSILTNFIVFIQSFYIEIYFKMHYINLKIYQFGENMIDFHVLNNLIIIVSII